MKKLLNTLYVTMPDGYLSKDGANVVVSADGKELFRIPVLNLDSICCFGYQGASPGLMRLCSQHGVGLSFFSPRDKFVARIQGPVAGNILLRKRQYEAIGDDALRLNVSKLFITGKIYNSRVALRRFLRDYPGRPGADGVEHAVGHLRYQMQRAGMAETVDTLRGIEGDAANAYFGVFKHLILKPSECFTFIRRVKRPPTDPVNAMLSFGYSMLANECASALEGVGLDPAAGFMHTLRPGRNSLALDLMEEMRSYIVDRLVLSIINNRQLNEKHFMQSDEDGLPVYFTDNGLKKFLSCWQTKKNAEITHPFLNEKIKLGLLPHVQALLLAKYLRGDLDNYPVFLSK